MAIVAVNMVPLGVGTSVSKYVAAAEKVIVDRPNIKRQAGPMFTTLEGDLDEIMQAIREMQEAVFAAGAARVLTTIKIDDRRDKESTMESKMNSLNAKLKCDN
ncbi:MAG TPA: MTH1187 family thiamine-binding protein [Peptococcaceae bacterium]|nr:MTH1187 family thiamine-binding protein [Peptococcaceae bacterium]